MARVVITGCNRGIGLELTRQLIARGDDVIGACRTSAAPLDELGVRVIDGVDVATAVGIARLRESLGDQPIDVLINNAGVLHRDALDSADVDAMLEQYRVNAIGPVLVTRALLGHLEPGAKVAIVTSRMGSIADNESGGYYGYRMSKAAVNIAGMSLARDLGSLGIAVALLHPGLVATDMTGGNGIDVRDAARGLLERIGALSMDSTGSFWHAEGYALPW